MDKMEFALVIVAAGFTSMIVLAGLTINKLSDIKSTLTNIESTKPRSVASCASLSGSPKIDSVESRQTNNNFTPEENAALEAMANVREEVKKTEQLVKAANGCDYGFKQIYEMLDMQVRFIKQDIGKRMVDKELKN